MTIFRHYAKGDPTHVATHSPRDRPFAAVDPGNQGVLLAWARGPASSAWPAPPDGRVLLGGNGSGMTRAAALCSELGVDVLLIESQFLKNSPSVLRHLAFASGMLVGHVREAKPDLAEVVLVPPWAWQKRLPRYSRNPKERALEHAIRRLGADWMMDQGNAALQQACADALGIADWWVEVTGEQDRSDF